MNDINKKADKILVERGYNFSISSHPENGKAHDLVEKRNVNPFYIGNDETLDLWGRRQLESIWNWILSNKRGLLIACPEHPPVLSEWDDRDYVIRRTKWVLNNMDADGL